MIVTPDFVFIHHPKTGGTFVTHMLAQLYGPPRGVPSRAASILFRTVRQSWPHEHPFAARAYLRALGHIDIRKRVHGSCNMIPKPFAHLPIVSCRRNPYDWYVSSFEFGWWRKDGREAPWWPEARRQIPHFPKLDFREYLEITAMMGPYTRWSPPIVDGLGMQTRDWIWRYCRNPRAVLEEIYDLGEAEAARVVRDDMHDVFFLRTEHLNQDLAGYLRVLGHDEAHLRPILDSGRVLPKEGGRPAGQGWEHHYTASLMAQVRDADRVLFALWPEYDD